MAASEDREALWCRLELTKTQVARLTGLSRRQIVYWASKGLIGRPDRKTFDGPAIEKVVLMKRALQKGTRLHEAARQAERELSRTA
jgi:DNA-binding transcriptional MerR regulator